ncbi:hypothetical protein GPALN_003051 [Globodera pallida]|nr:hypothetical protein GPALN_003051 [Globodera pallida]
MADFAKRPCGGFCETPIVADFAKRPLADFAKRPLFSLQRDGGFCETTQHGPVHRIRKRTRRSGYEMDNSTTLSHVKRSRQLRAVESTLFLQFMALLDAVEEHI